MALAEARTRGSDRRSTPQTIQQAFREVSDALVGYAKAREFRDQQELLATAAQDARRLADIRYQGGATSYLEVLDSDTRLFDAELGLAQARAGRARRRSSRSIARSAAAGSRMAGPGAGPPSSP